LPRRRNKIAVFYIRRRNRFYDCGGGITTKNWRYEMKLVYICSPYAMLPEFNTQMARLYCKAAMSEGVVPYAPHLLFPQWLDDAVPEQRETALEMGLEMLERCDELWQCGCIVSNGMKREIDYANKIGVAVIKRQDLLTATPEQVQNVDIERGDELCISIPQI
jgi:hypothetical protein